jgi:hypothetical protein
MAAQHHILPSRVPGPALVRRILLIGEYWSLLKSSAEVLRKTNSEIAYCSPSEIGEHWTRQFDLIVICHTVSAAEAESISADARWRWPGIRILQISRFDFGTARVPPYADAVAEGGKPDDLFACSMELLGRKLPPSAIAS